MKRIISPALLLAITLLGGCGSGNGRDVVVDTGGFGKPMPTINGTTDSGPGGSDPMPSYWDNPTDAPQTITIAPATIAPVTVLPTQIAETVSLEQALTAGTAVQYQRVVCYDQTLGCEAARSLMPMGWNAKGGVNWGGQSGSAPATMFFQVMKDDETAVVGYVSEMTYEEPDSQFAAWTPGQIQDGSLAPAKAVMSSQDYATEFFTQNIFPGIANMQIVEVNRPEGETANKFEQIRQELQRAFEQLAAQNAVSGMRIIPEAIIDFSETVFTFTSNGTPCKAKVMTGIRNAKTTTIMNTGYTTYNLLQQMWSVPFYYYYVAEESVYKENENICGEFLDNFIQNQQWNTAVTQAVTQIYQAQTDRQAAQYRQMIQSMQSQAQASAQSHSQSYSSGGGSGSSGSSVMDGWTNAITGNSYYEAPDGGSVLLNYNNYHYTDGSSIYSSSTPLNIGGTNLSELTDLGTMGGG